VRQTVDAGGTAYLYAQRYLTVDAQMNQMGSPTGLDIRFINKFTSDGWKVDAIIPRTYGGMKSYKTSKTNAYGLGTFGSDTHQVGLGGHVIGVYVLLSLAVSKATVERYRDTVQQVAKVSLPDELLD
jgi:hypothetical protein